MYGDFREFLEKEKLDAVSLALPDHWHGIIYTETINKRLPYMVKNLLAVQ